MDATVQRKGARVLSDTLASAAAVVAGVGEHGLDVSERRIPFPAIHAAEASERSTDGNGQVLYRTQ